MNITITKPDWGIKGGFELVIGRIVAMLEDAGHRVVVATVPGVDSGRTIRGVAVSDEHWARAGEFFTYASLLERFERINVADADLVITTQPGSWAVDHPRKLAVFYHHQRVAYDLEAPYIEAGLGDPEVHTSASELIRQLDTPHLGTISHFLVPSETVAGRLETFNNVDRSRMSKFLAGPHHVAAGPSNVFSDVLCVSRSEFTKRTELFAAAAFEGFGASARLVGTGGRLPFVRRYVADLMADVPREPEPWNAPAGTSQESRQVADGPVCISGWLDDAQVADAYRSAAVIVAPAHNEDYGLTLLEGMSYGKPVVVCSDGGGLVEMVDDGTTGVVTEPNPAAIAEAVRQLMSDLPATREMGSAALRSAERYTWQRAASQLLDGIERVMSC